VDRNVISGNTKEGVLLTDSGTSDNLIEGNLIGTDISGRSGLGNASDGIHLELGARNNTIGGATPVPGTGLGNVISGNGGDGVDITDGGTSGNVVAGNLIGTDASGRNGLANVFGVMVSASNNTVGGSTPAPGTGLGNVISGNRRSGIYIGDAGVTGNLVAGNLIGTDISGTVVLGNVEGISLSGAKNTIGGSTSVPGTGLGNVLSGNQFDGIGLGLGAADNVVEGNLIAGSNVTDNVVAGNLIGTDASGTAALGNSGAGVEIRAGASHNTVGGATPTPGTGLGNVISGNRGYGVDVFGTGTDANTVAGNLIGTDLSGEKALGNGDIGVYLSNGAADNMIGGAPSSPGTGLGNVISSNRLGVALVSSGTAGNVVAGNLIGTDAGGTRALGNIQDGVSIGPGASGNSVGGSSAGNVISGNAQNGVSIIGTGTTANVVAGNRIGTDLSGTAGVGNHLNGVLIEFGASDNTIGGTTAGAGNTIAFNAANGVQITSASGNAISANAIFANAGWGIKLGASANDSQAAPVLQAEDSSTLAGVLTSLPDTTFRLEFFGNTSRGPGGLGQGEDYLGALDVATDDSGQATFRFSFTPVAGKPFLTATATNLATQDTSEFSSSFVAPSVSVPPAQTTNEDAALILAGENAIVISDPSNDGSQPEQVTLAVEQGTLTLADTSGLIFLGGGKDSAAMTFQGTSAAVNSALDGLQYVAADFDGADTLTVSANNPAVNSGTTTGQVALTINFVNDQPSFTASDPPAVVENSGAQTVDGFVTSFDPGPGANEAGQTVLGYLVGNVSNPSLFAVLPAVDAAGTLTYTLAADAFGTSAFSVQVQESGGTANGGIDTSAAQTFTLVVQATPAPPAPAQPVPPPPSPPPPATASAPPPAAPAPPEPAPVPAPGSSNSQQSAESSSSTPTTSGASTTTISVAETEAASAAVAAAAATPGTAPARSGAASVSANQTTQEQTTSETSAAVVPVAGPGAFASILETSLQGGPQDGGGHGTGGTVVSLVETAQSRMANGAANVRPNSPGATEAQEVFVAKATHVASALLDSDDSIQLLEALLQGDQPPAPAPGLSRQFSADAGLAFQADVSPSKHAEKSDLRRPAPRWRALILWVVPPAVLTVFWVRRRRRRRRVISVPLAANAALGIRRRSA
jgi:hypothetical protein